MFELSEIFYGIFEVREQISCVMILQTKILSYFFETQIGIEKCVCKKSGKIADVVYGWSLSSQDLGNNVSLIQLKSILVILNWKAFPINVKLRSLKSSL